MSSVKENKNFNSKKVRELVELISFSRCLSSSIEPTWVQWKHGTSGWNHSKLLVCRTVQLVFFFTPSALFLVSTELFLVTSCLCKSCQVSGQWQVIGEMPWDRRRAASFSSAIHILSFPVSVIHPLWQNLCSDWLACCCSLQLKSVGIVW